jgi:hypothetical protein
MAQQQTCVIDRDRKKKAKMFLGLVLLILKIVLAILKLLGNQQ